MYTNPQDQNTCKVEFLEKNKINLKTEVGSDKVMKDFDPESVPLHGSFTNLGMSPSSETDSESKSFIALSLLASVFRINRITQRQDV